MAQLGSTIRRVFGRPLGISARARWLFFWLALLNLLLGGSGPLTSARGFVLLVGLSTLLALVGSCVFVYVSGRVPLGLDLLDAVAITGLAFASPSPQTVVGYLFASIWFRGLYGSTWRSLARSGGYVAAIVASGSLLTLTSAVTDPRLAPGLALLPSLLITIVVARQLGSGLTAREQSLLRDAALSDAGARLLELPDAVAIRSLAGTAAVQICVATPGLRILTVVRGAGSLRVEGGTGGLVTVPATLPSEVLAGDPAGHELRVAERAPLDDAVGSVLEWECVRLTEHGEEAWMLAGASKAELIQAMPAVRSLANQVKLALRNSDVHTELAAQAHTDSLTGLANRGSFTDSVTSALLGTEAADIRVLFVDLDDFKDVNDVFGHRAGDELLTTVANRILSCVRPKDTCARLGGDEFAVLLRGADDVSAVYVAERIVGCVAEPIHLGRVTTQIGVSIGISAGTPNAGIEDVVHQADVAMYAAKAYGKGRVQLFDAGLLHADASRARFDKELAGAAAAGQLSVHYQPILSLPDLRCTAVEALVRWQHPIRGLLSAAEFIEAAERTGAVIEIDDFVLGQACADVAGWLDGRPDVELQLHVNISPRQLDQDCFVDNVTTRLRETGLTPGGLVVELKEAGFLNSRSTIANLRSLSAQGVGLAIDDFGTGYAPLRTLRSLPISVIKFDSTFISEALVNPVDRAVMEAIVRMSTQLGFRTIAEGVERPDQQELLRRIGPDAVQGFLYLKPVPAQQFWTWLQSNLAGPRASTGNVIDLRRPLLA